MRSRLIKSVCDKIRLVSVQIVEGMLNVLFRYERLFTSVGLCCLLWAVYWIELSCCFLWQDLLAVGYGEFDLSYQNPGLVCCWSLKNHTVRPFVTSPNLCTSFRPLQMLSCVPFAVARSIHPLWLRRHLPGFFTQQSQSAGCGDDKWDYCHLWCAKSRQQDLCHQQLVRAVHREMITFLYDTVWAREVMLHLILFMT